MCTLRSALRYNYFCVMNNVESLLVAIGTHYVIEYGFFFSRKHIAGTASESDALIRLADALVSVELSLLTSFRSVTDVNFSYVYGCRSNNGCEPIFKLLIFSDFLL